MIVRELIDRLLYFEQDKEVCYSTYDAKEEDYYNGPVNNVIEYDDIVEIKGIVETHDSQGRP